MFYLQVLENLKIIKKLPKAGADFIEIGMPFTDPMADGVAIQASYLRALKSGQTLAKTLSMVKEFRKIDKKKEFERFHKKHWNLC